MATNRRASAAAVGNKTDGTQALDRALSILRIVGSCASDGMRLVDIVTRSQLSRPTAHRMLKALEQNGFVEQDAVTRLYHLGPDALVLGIQAGSRFGILPTAAGALTRLATASHDTAFLSVRRDVYALCLARYEGDYPIRTHVLQAGSRYPLGVGAGSLAMLAVLPDPEIDAILEDLTPELAASYPSFTPAFLRKAVAETRRQGYAFNPGRLLAGSWAIGMAVVDSTGHCLGALSISAIESRLGPQRRADLVPLLRQEAERLAKRLSQPTPPPAIVDASRPRQ